MEEQQTFAGLAWSGKKKQTRREQFLAEMNAVIPWAELRALIAPYYLTGTGGRRAMPLERMLRICFLQHWYDLSDPAAEDALYDSEAMRRFVGVELGEDAVPDETTILHFRHLLEKHHLTEQMFDLVRRLLETRLAAQERDRGRRHDPPRAELDEERDRHAASDDISNSPLSDI
jgi:hypothetical protein